MDNAVVMSEIKCYKKLYYELPHDRLWYHVFTKQGAKAAECLSHEFKDKAFVCAIRALMLKVVKKVADKGIARMALISIAKMGKNIHLKRLFAWAVVRSAQYLECPKFFGIIVVTLQSGVSALHDPHWKSCCTHLACKSLTSHTVE